MTPPPPQAKAGAARTSRAFIEEERYFSGEYAKQVFQTIGFAYRPFLLASALVLFSGLLARTALLLNANVMGYWADSLCTGSDCEPLPGFFHGFGARGFVFTLLALSGSGFVLNTVFRVGIARLGTHAISSLYDEVTIRTSRLPMTFFDRTPVGRIVARFSSDYNAVFRMAGGPMGEFFSICFDLAISLVLVSVASPLYIPLVAVTVGLNALVYRANRDSMRTARRAVSVARAPAIAHFAETAQGARTIRAFGKAPLFASRFARLVRQYLLQRARTLLVVQGFSLQMGFLTSFLLLGTGLLGIWFVREGWVSVGSIAVAFTFVMMTSSTVQQLFEYLANLEEALTGVERLDDYLRRPIEPGAFLPPHAAFPTGHRRLEAMPDPKIPRGEGSVARGAIDVAGLALRYRPDLPRVLDGFSFRLRAGEHVGVVGRTGCGKSSLIQALLLLYPWEEGCLALDGLMPEIFASQRGSSLITPSFSPRGSIPVDAYRRNLSLIPQDPSLFRGTLRENLVGGFPVDGAAALAALERVGLAGWAAGLGGNPLDFRVEERGANLSTGQRQLLCMARCLLQDTSVVLMDEATSSVDPVTEENLLHATRELLASRTQIIVAHRLSTIEHCDRILWIKDGRIHRDGPPSEILPAYRREDDARDGGGPGDCG